MQDVVVKQHSVHIYCNVKCSSSCLGVKLGSSLVAVGSHLDVGCATLKNIVHYSPGPLESRSLLS